MMKVSTHQKCVRIINIYAPNSWTHKYMKQALTALKGRAENKIKRRENYGQFKICGNKVIHFWTISWSKKKSKVKLENVIEIRKIEHTVIKTLWSRTKAVLRGKFKAVNVIIKTKGKKKDQKSTA